MKNSISKTKMTATIVLVLLMASVTLMAMPVQGSPLTRLTNVQDGGSKPLPSGVTPDVSYDTIAHMSFRPNPIGVGQPLLVNMWLQPPIHISRYFKQAFLVTIDEARRNQIHQRRSPPIHGDTTAWFEYVVDQIGTWKIKFDFLGAYFPPGNYTMSAGY